MTGGPNQPSASPRAKGPLRIMPRIELNDRSRFLTAGLTVVVQMFLYHALWSSLYGAADVVVAGANATQSTSYSVLAVLSTVITWASRSYSKETMRSLVNEGRIMYWFLRPMAPRRFYFLRVVGELLYGTAWLLPAVVLAVSAGLVMPPPSAAALFAALVGFALGQVVAYYLRSCVDLACFWFTTNESTIRIYFFVQALLSGALVPLWFFPPWFGEMSSWLPFQGIHHIPLSVYVGRRPLETLPCDLFVALCWVAVLGLVTRVMWRAAARRVSVQGG
ncbi:ABC transporter permease [Saccharothrix deserti]|uniref:ABC transporter permease n=1 Tax=Saccharothrix deserti TaxID=2593674 RepID=UPI00131D0B0A|nr:ABC-2 family transporter protein [Saccharothrix deserti]